MLDPHEVPARSCGAPADGPGAAGPRRRRGRPLLVSRESVLERIRTLAARGDGLFRVHRSHGSLYARARRMFGSWRAAVLAAGVDYREVVTLARRRAQRARGRRGPGADPGG